jgi:hypothetical protein
MNSVFQPKNKTREVPSSTAHLIFQIAASPVSSGSPTVCPHPSFAHKPSRARTIWIITASQSSPSTLQRGRAERRILRDETLALSADIQKRQPGGTAAMKQQVRVRLERIDPVCLSLLEFVARAGLFESPPSHTVLHLVAGLGPQSSGGRRLRTDGGPCTKPRDVDRSSSLSRVERGE